MARGQFRRWEEGKAKRRGPHDSERTSAAKAGLCWRALRGPGRASLPRSSTTFVIRPLPRKSWPDAGGGARATYFESQRQSQNLDGQECPSHTGSVPHGHFPQTVDRKRRRSGMSGAPEGWVGVRRYCTTIVKVVGVPVTLPEVAFTEIV